MMNKMFAISMFVLLLLASSVSAYDLEILSFSTSEPVEAGQTTTISITVQNNDNTDDFVRTTEQLSVQYGDGASESQVVPDLAGGAQTTIQFTHTYTQVEDVTVQAQLINLANDSNSGNNDVTRLLSVTNDAPVITAIPAQEIIVGNAFTYDSVVATDDEGDAITLGISSNNNVGLQIDSTGFISGWTPTVPGSEVVTVTADDVYNTPSQTSFTVTVLPSTASLSTSLSGNTLVLGGTNQARSVTGVTQSFTITNDGTQTLSAITATPSNFASQYNVQVSVGQTTLARGESTQVTLTFDVPSTQDSQALKIGDLQLSAQGSPDVPTIASIAVNLQTESKLRIDTVEIEVDGDDEKISDGENYDEVKEESEIKFTINIENIYTNSEDIEIEDVFVKIEADENDWDIDDESSDETIDADDDEEFTVTFTVGDDIDDDTTDVLIEVFGDDEQGNFVHYDSLEFTLEIEREDDEITIKQARFDTNPIQCTDRSVEFYVEIENTGTDDQNDAAIEINSDDLGFSTFENDIELDEGDDWDKTYDIRLPSSLDEGTYRIEVEAFYNDDERTDREVIDLIVDCGIGSSSSTTSSDSSSSGSSSGTSGNTGSGSTIVVNSATPSGSSGSGSVIVANPQPSQPTPTPSFGSTVFGQPVETRSSSFADSPTYLILLAAVAVLIMIGIVAMLFSVGKKR